MTEKPTGPPWKTSLKKCKQELSFVQQEVVRLNRELAEVKKDRDELREIVKLNREINDEYSRELGHLYHVIDTVARKNGLAINFQFVRIKQV